MKKLSSINQIILPLKHIESVYRHLRQVGSEGLEGVALWAGSYISETEFEVKTTIIPAQKAYNHESGLLYAVEESELHRINEWLYTNKHTLIAQIHSHPNEAYHSEIDDAYPIITRLGGVSIVVPNFGFRPFFLSDWAVYRLVGETKWSELSHQQVQSLITIIS